MRSPQFESELKLTRREPFNELIDVELAEGVVLRAGRDDVTTHCDEESLVCRDDVTKKSEMKQKTLVKKVTWLAKLIT